LFGILNALFGTNRQTWFIKSLLEAAGIPYLTRGEDQYDAFRGAFRATVFSPHGRPVVFLVPASMAEEARLLLQEGELPDEGT